jgi:hypothetical protein
MQVLKNQRLKHIVAVIIIIVIQNNCGGGGGGSSPQQPSQPETLLYEESFDSVNPTFDIPQDSLWAFVEGKNEGDNYSGNFHLSNRLNSIADDNYGEDTIQAMMRPRITIQDHINNPTLSFWYKLNLNHPNERIFIDIHFFDQQTNHPYLDRSVIILKQSDNTNDYQWKSYDLNKYKGYKVSVAFRESGNDSGQTGSCSIDDLRITDLEMTDSNNNNIPDDYEQGLNANKLPYLKNVNLITTPEQNEVIIKWSPLEDMDQTDGYNIYRGTSGQQAAKLNSAIIDSDVSAYTDSTVVENNSYYYYVVAVSSQGEEGYPSKNVNVKLYENTPPSISDISKTIEEDESCFFTKKEFMDVFEDVDQDELQKIMIISLPEHGNLLMHSNAVNVGDEVLYEQIPHLQFVPEKNWNGQSSFFWKAVDAFNDTSEKANVIIHIKSVEDPPEISKIPDQTMQEDASLDDVSFLLNDPDTPISEITVFVESSNKVLLPDDRIIIKGNSNNRTIAITPVMNQSGTTTIRLLVSDETRQINENFNLTVTAVADPPKLTTVESISGFSGTWIPLLIEEPKLTDTDGSEVFGLVKIENVPVQAVLSSGDYDTETGLWILEASQLSLLSIMPKEGYGNDFVVSVHIESIETSNNDTFTSTRNIRVIVNNEVSTNPQIKISNSIFQSDGQFQVYKNIFPCKIEGSYDKIEANLVVKAVSGNKIIEANATNGFFSLFIPDSGLWEIQLLKSSGEIINKTKLEIFQDFAPPVLKIEGEPTRTVDFDFIQISGMALDYTSGVDVVFVQSDRYPDVQFNAMINERDTFSAEIPLKNQMNLLRITARDIMANEVNKTITVNVSVAELPRITILTPENGAVFKDDRIDVSGMVRSSLPPDQIRLHLQDQVIFAQGSDGNYTFAFHQVQLLKTGVNQLTVTAEMVHGEVQGQTSVLYDPNQTEEDIVKPQIELLQPRSETIINEFPLLVSGVATSENGIKEIFINNQEADCVGKGSSEVSFDLLFSASIKPVIPIEIIAIDSLNISNTLLIEIQYDATPPVIQLENTLIQELPVINNVNESPYPLSLILTESHLAGFSVNGNNAGVLPGSDESTWLYEARLELVRDETRYVQLDVWDIPGNRTSMELAFKLDTHVDLNIIKPEAQHIFQTADDRISIDIQVEASGLKSDDTLYAMIDNGTPIQLERLGSIANSSISITASQGTYELIIYGQDSKGIEFVKQRCQFTIENTSNIPLTVDRQVPGNNEINVEPNEFIAFYFNRSFDPEKLTITVLETAHGEIYTSTKQGVNFTEMNNTELVEIHRENQPVPGGLSYFPENTMAAFYPQRDYAYGGDIYITISYNKEKNVIWRSIFQIRPLPTFVQGFVADQFMTPLEGIEVVIPDLKKTATTDSNGSYGFGFGEPANQAIPPGRHRALINPNMENHTYGSVQLWINIEQNRLNEMGVNMIPILNPEVPFRRVRSYQSSKALLAENELTLSLENTLLTFPNGRTEGDIHVQFMQLNQLGYKCFPSAMPNWAFAIHPIEIKVSGEIQMTFNIPDLYGMNDYVKKLSKYVLLIGLDEHSLQIVPTGVGRVDTLKNQVISEKIEITRLDYLGYALVPSEAQSILEQYIKGEIGLREMIGMIESLR